MALLGIPSGALIERLGGRRTMLVSDALRAPLIALVPLLHWTGRLASRPCSRSCSCSGCSPRRTSRRSADHPRAVRRRRAARLEGVGALRRSDAADDRDRSGARRRAGRVARRAGGPAVDAATYLFAFACVALSSRAAPRRAGRRRARPARGHPLPGARPPARPDDADRDPARRRRRRVRVAVPLLAYTRYDGPARRRLAVHRFGVGALIGSGRHQAARPVSAAAPRKHGDPAAILPLWVIAAPVSWPVACAAVVTSGLFIPMVNAPIMGLLSTRPPLRSGRR